MMFVYRTKGICPPEIHFELSGGVLKNVSFVGGGCRGNAQLISRLLEGRELDLVLPLLRDIQCRNGTSCPGQLLSAVESAIRGDLPEAGAIRVYEVTRHFTKVAVAADIKGDLQSLVPLLRLEVDALICLGRKTGRDDEGSYCLDAAAVEKVIFIKGPEERSDCPHFISFGIGKRRVVGFYGGFIQEQPGFSDFSRFSLELLMVCNLSDYLRKEEVFPALATMTDQFEADVVLFAHTGLFRHIKVGRVDFINVGQLKQECGYRYTLLELDGDELKVSFKLLD